MSPEKSAPSAARLFFAPARHRKPQLERHLPSTSEHVLGRVGDFLRNDNDRAEQQMGLTLRDWACTWNVTQSLVSYIDPNNFRSCRLAERLGGILDAKAERRDPVDLVYRYH